MRRRLQQVDQVLMHPWTNRLGALGALSAFAVFVVGLVGGLVTTVLDFPTAWAIVTGVGAVLTILGGVPLVWPWFRRTILPMSDSELGERALGLGNEIKRFSYERRKSQPVLDPSETPQDEWVWVRSRGMAHNLITQRRYKRRFDTPVFHLVRELKDRGHIQPEEASLLSDPPDVGHIDQAGERLSQLGTRLQGDHP